MGLKWRPEIHVHDIVDKTVKKNNNRSFQFKATTFWNLINSHQGSIYVIDMTGILQFYFSTKLNLYTDITRAWETSRKKEIVLDLPVIETFILQEDNGYEYEIWLKVCSSIDTPESFIALLFHQKN